MVSTALGQLDTAEEQYQEITKQFDELPAEATAEDRERCSSKKLRSKRRRCV